MTFQSTLSVRRATYVISRELCSCKISIHALREESDYNCDICAAKIPDFNPRSPWGERHNFYFNCAFMFLFQSTLSVRRATERVSGGLICNYDFNPRSPWGERRCYFILRVVVTIFQSTLSVRRATCLGYSALTKNRYFNPRSPWGERPRCFRTYPISQLFQSTLSVRRATQSYSQSMEGFTISIHALREESDLVIKQRISIQQNFNPRSPWGERPIIFSSSI